MIFEIIRWGKLEPLIKQLGGASSLVLTSRFNEPRPVVYTGKLTLTVYAYLD